MSVGKVVMSIQSGDLPTLLDVGQLTKSGYYLYRDCPDSELPDMVYVWALSTTMMEIVGSGEFSEEVTHGEFYGPFIWPIGRTNDR
jgi:hypothetical protein